MESAIIFYSWQGLMTEKIRAIEVKSTADARKLGPFVDDEKRPLLWVNWSKERIITKKKTRPYFRSYPKQTILKRQVFQSLDEVIKERQSFSESDIHKKARLLIKEILESYIANGEQINWAYKDPKVSDFSLTGNLLSEVEKVETNYPYHTPFGKDYNFDIVLLGKKLNKERVLLGAIEIEKTHRFDLLKLLISKSLGFPLVSINVEDLKFEDIDLEWAKAAISETKENSIDGLRRNYIYIHNSLYPVFLNIPYEIRNDLKHQFIIFCNDENIEKLTGNIKTWKKILSLSDNEVLIQPVRINYQDTASVNNAENEGSIAGFDWREYNRNRYIRLTLDVPKLKSNSIYLFHICLARLLNTHFETLVGYKYKRGLFNETRKDQVWTDSDSSSKVAQKNMSEPIKIIIDHLQEFGIIDKYFIQSPIK